jgi:hypothetical protein
MVNPNLTSMPVYTAFGVSHQQVAGAKYSGVITTTDVGITGVHGYKFRQNGTPLWTIWSADGSTRTVTLPAKPTAVYDLMGMPVAVSASRQFTLIAPNRLFVYIKW